MYYFPCYGLASIYLKKRRLKPNILIDRFASGSKSISSNFMSFLSPKRDIFRPTAKLQTHFSWGNNSTEGNGVRRGSRKRQRAQRAICRVFSEYFGSTRATTGRQKERGAAAPNHGTTRNNTVRIQFVRRILAHLED